MNFGREIQRLGVGLLAAFLLVMIAATYWAIVGYESLLNRDDNPRRVEAEARILRGAFYDRAGVLLAQTSVDPQTRRTERRYMHPALYSALGYFSLRYGTGGAENAYNAILRGDTLPTYLERYFERDVLHQAQQGSAVRLTLSLTVQQAIAQAMGNRQGAVVVLSVPNGEVLALLSQPTYNPNTLDTDWETLIQAEGNPFFNRVLQGRYQPGGTLQTLLMATALLSNVDVTTVRTNATAPLDIGETVLRCVNEPPQADFDLLTAYAYGCPQPFVELAQELGQERMLSVLPSFHLNAPPMLAGFVAPLPAATAEATPESTPSVTTIAPYVREMVGQGQQTVSPLGMAQMMAAFVNMGNAPLPHILAATRAPNAEWLTVSPEIITRPMLTAQAAQRMSEILLANPLPITETLPIGGQVALAYSGEGTQTWFWGFVQTDDGQAAVIAVVLEDTADPAAAATIGQIGLTAAHELLAR
jgi:peptidoglycan glycosyltransferase